MRYHNPLLNKRACLDCPQPDCAVCPAGSTCDIIIRTCDACYQVQCRPDRTRNAGGSGVSGGAIGGAVVGVLILLGTVGAAYVIWRRKRQAAHAAVNRRFSTVKDIPANPDTVLSRPDPIEKTPTTTTAFSTEETSNIKVYTPSHTSINLDPEHTIGQAIMTDPNPFADQASIQTASDRATNVIPIAYVPPPDNILHQSALTQPPTPARPHRSPDLNLRLEPGAGPHEPLSPSFLTPYAQPSVRSGVSGVSSRASYMSGTSSILDLNEAPTIVTAGHGAVRQVMGITKAEVVQVPPSTPGASLRVPSQYTRPPTSPLAQSSYTMDEGTEENPFSDEAAASVYANASSRAASVKSMSTFGSPIHANWPPTSPAGASFADSRPASTFSIAGTITADISNATRVVFSGIQSPNITSPTNSLQPPARVITPQHQQQRPEEVDITAQRASVVSRASSRVDSILEAFPFVPPSPISARPPRSPVAVNFQPPSPTSPSPAVSGTQQQKPSRHTLGLSTFSQASASSSGLDAFTFQFEDGEMPPLPQNPNRASLDTLALSRDLDAFPLAYDGARDSFAK